MGLPHNVLCLLAKHSPTKNKNNRIIKIKLKKKNKISQPKNFSFLPHFFFFFFFKPVFLTNQYPFQGLLQEWRWWWG